MTTATQPDAPEVIVSDEARLKAEEFIEAEEGAANKLKGWLGVFVTAVAFVMSAFHLYTAYAIVPTQTLRPVHVGFVLFLCFLVFPVATRFRHRVMWWDWLAAVLSIAVVVYLILGGDDFTDRNTSPNPWDITFGLILIALVLEAMRRTNGWIMPIITSAFLAYALLGPWLPAPWTHKGYEIGRLVGVMYMTLEGIYGVAIDVSASLIILFTIFGAFLQYSGAGKFYIDFSFSAMGGKPTGAGRTVVLASFLLGGPSGSGVATTVTLGAVAYPMLAKVGYEKNAAGGLLAAGGLGAIISPPVLGAAAFLIAEFLKISYLDVLLMAVIPTILFYLALFLMVEIDARKYGMGNTKFDKVDSVWNLTRKYWFHFLSLISIVFFMMWGFSPVLSVFWATVVSFFTSFLRRDTALLSYDLFTGKGSITRNLFQSPFVKAMEGGSIGVLNVAATCAGAGIIVGVVTLTGLGLKFSTIVIDYAGGNLLLTAIFTSLVVWIVGLAVPVTASYIICAVIAAPALIKLGVPDFAAHMFIFYYAVLSEVSPPTALSPFAAAAITGGDPYKTTLQCWKYTVPAFLVPFMFVLDPSGQGLLLMGSTKALASANWWSIAEVTLTAAIGIAALAGGFQGWALKRCTAFERWMLIVAGFALVYPSTIADVIGFGLVIAALTLQYLRKELQPQISPALPAAESRSPHEKA
ncbi:TRAP transporter fused permease subunit [Polaromonas sp.]|jgi:TRAP transporter 4TM/12TM fusion protein|uniref:TRAP transporter permease n=1 Tax=Polaromonas sp. TaxID=1869339 RepID=UPI002CE45A0C|nr:TRAP transporter fused permease subunit [Polaromonas sp.]HQS30417.1 TRAP transporter fused permease subunit [Polaromonas sp.]HQS90850.1 TRAP transporter fused permease subunit [Polaromonas sp.]